MKKLNKNGWGFLEFFCFLVVFVVCLVGAFKGLQKLGLLDENNQFINNKNNSSSTNNKKDEEEKPKVSYKELQENMVEAAKKYISDNYNNQLGLDTLNIRVSQLKNTGLLKKLEDNEGRDCSGYVSVSVDASGENLYMPYLKCKDYVTEGYEERKDD